MRAVDTNVLVRYFARDDAAQHEAAALFLEGAAERGEPIFVSDAVLCELVWVLGRAYRQDRATLVTILTGLARARHITFAARTGVEDALAAFTRGRGDFADYLIRARALAAGCEAVVTFDRALHGEPGFAAPA